VPHQLLNSLISIDIHSARADLPKGGIVASLPNQPPKFLQLYSIGNEQVETDQRCTYIQGTRSQIVLNLQRMFHEHYHLTETFKTALERKPTDEYKVVIGGDQRLAGEHKRRFNAPQVDEVAVVISGDEFHQRDIAMRRFTAAHFRNTLIL
jgi:hypothetical protein